MVPSVPSAGDIRPGCVTAGSYTSTEVGASLDRMTKTRWSAVRDEQVPEDVDRLLATVPEWFGQPDSNAEYVEDSRTLETWTVRDENGRVRGVTLVARHFPHVAEIHLIVVDRSAHGSGVGTAMIRTMPAPATSTRRWDSFPWRRPTCGARRRHA